MDESWRMRMGTPSLPRRRSTEETLLGRSRTPSFSASQTLDPNDFADVFGGPPRSVLDRKLSGDFSDSSSFYEEIFRPTKFLSPVTINSGRILPGFRLPGKKEEFYSDIFGWNDHNHRSRDRSRPRSKAKSRSNSSSVLSSEELSPLRPVVGDDPSLSSFASKLRPISVPYRWKSSTIMPEVHPKIQERPYFPYDSPTYIDNQYMENAYKEDLKNSHHGFLGRVSSPETITLDPNLFRSFRVSVDDLELNSPSSVVSSLHQDAEAKIGIRDENMQEQEVEQDEDEMSSYVIEISSGYRDGTSEVGAVDEAIAWAKEKFQSQTKDHSTEMQQKPIELDILDRQVNGHNTLQYTTEQENKSTTEGEKHQSENDMEIMVLDEDIQLWSAGKETNIRSLLSTLHHIFPPDSGWYAITLTSLIESSHVKKAYQKARLCLHPDKLQQKGATFHQKYVSEKVFSILQDAWASFISQDVIL